ncbi:MAG: 2-C-methyl-D-erythritol 2,4-cyclodiphosphate synthase [Candidatus Omnitrophota bacterium]
MALRVGTGYDIHRLVRGRKLFLGGVEIPFERGLLGHSDGDVLLHAICDALFGACGLGDIGMHFPDTVPELKGIASIELLKQTLGIINKEKRCNIVNIDTVVVCDKPKLSKYVPDIKSAISGALNISPDTINIKAKTTEETNVDAIASYAVVLVEIEG